MAFSVIAKHRGEKKATWLQYAFQSLWSSKSESDCVDKSIGKIVSKRLPERVEVAFSKVPPSKLEIACIKALILNAGSTSAQLSAACGWKHPAWQTHFSLICQRRRRYLWPEEFGVNREFISMIDVMAVYCPKKQTVSLKPEISTILKSLCEQDITITPIKAV